MQDVAHASASEGLPLDGSFILEGLPSPEADGMDKASPMLDCGALLPIQLVLSY